MKVAVYERELKLDNKLLVAVDVGKARLDCYSPFDKGRSQMIMRDTLENRSNAIRGGLLGFQKLAAENGMEGVHIVCEPTGGCERTLLRIAHELGISTAYVNGESVSKLRVVRQNDTGKTDELDPVIIHLASTQGRQLRVRHLDGHYAELRELNMVYDQVCDEASELKNCIHDALYRIFPDLRMSVCQLFGPCGEALVRAFGADPAAIARLSLDCFIQRMKHCAPRLRTSTLKSIHTDAQVNALHFTVQAVREIQRDHLRDLYRRWSDLDVRKEDLKQQMRDIYRNTPEARLLQITMVPEFIMARIIGETGPLSDYAHFRRLLRMAGLNLRERKSGKYKGKTKISKKGRARLRKILYQTTLLFLIKPGGIYSAEYAKRKIEGASSKSTIVAFMRKFVHTMYGTYRSGKPFTVERLTVSQSQYDKAA